MKSLFLLLFIFPALSWAQTKYVVRRGDTLLKIADRALGSPNDPRRYEFVKKIRKLNPDIANPNELEPGLSLNLPSTGPVVTKQKAPVEVAEPVTPPTPAPKIDPAPAVHEQARIQPPEQELVHANPQPVAPAPQHEEKPHTQEQSAHAAHEAGHSNFIFVQPRYQTVKLEAKELATETEATMKSKSSYGLDIQYGWILNENFHLLFQAGFTQTQFKDIEGEDPLISVNHTSETLKSFALGIAYEATSTLHMDLMIMQAEHTFLLPEVLPAYELHAVAIPGAELNISWDLYSGSANIFGISAIGEYIGALKKDSVEYKSALESLGALYWKSNYGHDSTNYKVTLTYKHGHQDTDLTEQKEELATLGLGFYF